MSDTSAPESRRHTTFPPHARLAVPPTCPPPRTRFLAAICLAEGPRGLLTFSALSVRMFREYKTHPTVSQEGCHEDGQPRSLGAHRGSRLNAGNGVVDHLHSAKSEREKFCQYKCVRQIVGRTPHDDAGTANRMLVRFRQASGNKARSQRSRTDHRAFRGSETLRRVTGME